MTRVHLSSMVQTAGRHYCLLYLLSQTDLVDLLDREALYHIYKNRAQGQTADLHYNVSKSPAFHFAHKASVADMKSESYEQDI